MKDYLRTLTQDSVDPIQGRNKAREYIQARILESLQRSGAFINLAFHGGTALRLLYGLQRFSEDLDFALENPSSNYDFQYYLNALKKMFISEGYKLEIRLKLEKTVQSAFLKFIELPYELGLSPYRNENLSIKIEVDTNPPVGAGLVTTIVRRYVFLNLHHHDRSSLFAGKLHALLSRNFTKGRDLYDLMWYLSDPNWPSPNYVLLKNALIQTGWKKDIPDERNWRVIVIEKVSSLDWKKVISDVKPFLENMDGDSLLTKDNLVSILRKSNKDQK